MTYMLLWLWFCGAFQMWEEIRDQPSGPDPRGAFYHADLTKFYKEHPELHAAQHIVVNVTVIVLWPVVMTIGILHTAFVKIRRPGR